jgi:hypothetical protein
MAKRTLGGANEITDLRYGAWFGRRYSIATHASVRFAAAVLLLAAHAIDALGLPLPQNRRQVPRDIFGKGPLRAGLQFGFEMGTGARTYVTSVAPYAVAAGVLLLAPPFNHALLAGVGFGLGRWAVPIGWAVHGESWIDRFVTGGRTVTLLGIAAIAVALLI